MTERPFTHHRAAALALLSACPDLSHKAAGFLGHVCVAHVLSDKQRDWNRDKARIMRTNGQD